MVLHFGQVSLPLSRPFCFLAAMKVSLQSANYDVKKAPPLPSQRDRARRCKKPRVSDPITTLRPKKNSPSKLFIRHLVNKSSLFCPLRLPGRRPYKWLIKTLPSILLSGYDATAVFTGKVNRQKHTAVCEGCFWRNWERCALCQWRRLDLKHECYLSNCNVCIGFIFCNLFLAILKSNKCTLFASHTGCYSNV